MLRWRRGSESNRRPRLCRPLHDHSATPPGVGAAAHARVAALQTERESWSGLSRGTGAGKESRTPDLNLGKVALYQLSYSRGGLQLYHRSAYAQPRAEPSIVAAPITVPALAPRRVREPLRRHLPRIRCSSN